MIDPFDEVTRHEIASRCAAFQRLPGDDTISGLKRAAVAIALAKADGSMDGTALLLTLRAAGLRAHGNQWALPGGRCDEGETPMTAALRELDEEIGLKLAPDDVLGHARRLSAGIRLEIAPIDFAKIPTPVADLGSFSDDADNQKHRCREEDP
jgi:8-oxo-dGTP pyrophosphatase MutT (NUDIX family)